MGLQRRKETVQLDVSADYTGGVIWAVQGEVNSLELDIVLSQAGELINLLDTDTNFKFLAAHGFRGGAAMGSDICIMGEELGHLTVYVPRDAFTESGVTQCAVDIFDQNTGILVKTPPFTIHVLQSL